MNGMTTYFDTEEQMKVERKKLDVNDPWVCGFDTERGKWYLTTFKDVTE